MMLIHSKSLNWLTRHFKGFGCPLVLISETPLRVDAYYDWDWGFLTQIDDTEIVNQDGLIVISSDSQLPEETLILHEFRHHLQAQLNGHWSVPDWEAGELIDEYNQCVYEKDARLFEVSLGQIDEFTDSFETPIVPRSVMLSLPTPEFLSGLCT